MSNHYKDYRQSQAKTYWSGWPMSGQYLQDLKWASEISIKYLRSVASRVDKRNAAVIFDVDETIMFGDPEELLGVREMELGVHDGQEIFILPPNPPISKVVSESKRLGFKIIVLTARPATSKKATLTNLDMFKIPYDYIIMNNKESDPDFKISARRQLFDKFNIILTVGDQPCDCLLPGRSAVLKLPDPTSKCAYFYPGMH